MDLELSWSPHKINLQWIGNKTQIDAIRYDRSMLLFCWENSTRWDFSRPSSKETPLAWALNFLGRTRHSLPRGEFPTVKERSGPTDSNWKSRHQADPRGTPRPPLHREQDAGRGQRPGQALNIQLGDHLRSSKIRQQDTFLGNGSGPRADGCTHLETFVLGIRTTSDRLPRYQVLFRIVYRREYSNHQTTTPAGFTPVRSTCELSTIPGDPARNMLLGTSKFPS